MFASIFVTAFILIALAGAFASDTGRGLITRRPYNNRYSDATAAREDRDL
jgi:hypothetical protein